MQITQHFTDTELTTTSTGLRNVPPASALLSMGSLSSLEAARLRLGDETTSLNHWLLVHNPEGREIEIPARFIEVGVVEQEEEAVDYDLDLLADSLV